MLNLAIFIANMLAAQPLFAQADTLPFSLNSQNNICVRTRLNGSDTLVLMFHTASTGVTLTQDAVTKKLRGQPLQSTSVTTWGGRAEAGYFEGNTLDIKGLHWDSLTVFVNQYSGPDTDGKFGIDLFKGKIVRIEYDKQWIIVQSALPKIPKNATKLPMIFRNETLHITGTLQIGKDTYRDTFMFHTGYGGGILLDPKLGEQYQIHSKLTTISTSELKDAYGNVFKIDTKNLPTLKIGRSKVKDVPLSFTARSSEIPMKVFGNGLLKRFDVILDLRQNEVYLRKNGQG
jgi:hypothetical protein